MDEMFKGCSFSGTVNGRDHVGGIAGQVVIVQGSDNKVQGDTITAPEEKKSKFWATITDWFLSFFKKK